MGISWQVLGRNPIQNLIKELKTIQLTFAVMNDFIYGMILEKM